MDLLTIADAAKLTERHEKTIRRWIKKQLDIDAEARAKIVQEAIAGGFGYRIDRDYLLAHFPTPLDNFPGRVGVQSPEPGAGHSTGQPIQSSTPLIAAKDETIALLKDQIKHQNEELGRKNEQVNTLLERLREQNILLKGYQDKYLLEASKESTGMDSPPRETSAQDTGQAPGQGRQANFADSGTNHQRKESNVKKRKAERKPQGTEQPQRKGWLSFLRGK